MKKIIAAYSIIYLISNSLLGQEIPEDRLVDWSIAGVRTDIPQFSRQLNILDYGGSSDSSASNNAAMTAALAAAQPGTVIYFPPGRYRFDNNVNITKDSIIIRGAGSQTRLYFHLGGLNRNMINFIGTENNADRWLKSDVVKGNRFLTVHDATPFQPEQWIRIMANDSSIIQSVWAYKSVGQIAQIDRVSGDTLYLKSTLRISWRLSDAPRVRIMSPRKYVGIEQLYMERIDAVDAQTVNVNFSRCVDSWMLGVESNLTNLGHVVMEYSSNLTMRGCYLHHSHSYGTGGRGYGLVLQFTAGECLIEDNQFNNLRHSILHQAGPNGNVVAYNHSVNPFWTSIPNNSAGDLVMHGNYPYANLCEGNVIQHIVIDYSHFINGPHNTFFRNKAQGYGLFMAPSAGNSQHFVGNDIPNTGLLLGAYTLTGSDHFQYGNRVRGVNNVRPAGTTDLTRTSYYLCQTPAWWEVSAGTWPNIGIPYPYNSTDIPASSRWKANLRALHYIPEYRLKPDNEQKTWYRDADGDGFGNPALTLSSCAAPAGYVSNNQDCDDTNAEINPTTVWYEDKDNDGYSTGNTLTQCQKPANYVLKAQLKGPETDCNDNNPAINPTAAEICDGLDNNCNNLIDDQDPELDPDSANLWFRDADNDGFGNPAENKIACNQPAGFVANNQDCNDANAAINPNTLWYEDKDNDGFSTGNTLTQCNQPTGYQLVEELINMQEDCDDNSASIYPGAAEIANDGIDQDCDGEDLITTGIANEKNISATLYPNPNDGAAQVLISLRGAAEVHVLITDVSGRQVLSEVYQLATGQQLLPIQWKVAGWYIVSIMAEGEIVALPMVVR